MNYTKQTITFDQFSATVYINNPKELIQAHWAAGNFYECRRKGLLVTLFTLASNGHSSGSFGPWGNRLFGGSFFDVGANIGNHTVFFETVLGGMVHSFEPHVRLCRHLQKNAGPRTMVNELALSSKAGLFHYLKSDAPISQGGDGMGKLQRAGGDWTWLVETTTLDKYVEETAVDRLDFIKMDIEGGEHDALLGAKKTIDRFRPLISTESNSSKEFKQIKATLNHWNYQIAVAGLNGGNTTIWTPK
jgi:FkbM family methyltransferase